MRRSGFTMVELIFVIVIIGILAATALPKFGGTKDNAKSSSEMAAMGSLDGAIVGAKEFRIQDYKDTNVIWHGNDTNVSTASTGTFKDHNTNHRVLKTILNKGEQFYIVGAVGMNSDGNATIASIANESTDILLITGPASDSETGIKEPTSTEGGDVPGRPDRSDLWVFNPNNVDINISSSTITLRNGETTIPAQSIKLLDVNATSSVNVASLSAKVNASGAAAAVFEAIVKK